MSGKFFMASKPEYSIHSDMPVEYSLATISPLANLTNGMAYRLKYMALPFLLVTTFTILTFSSSETSSSGTQGVAIFKPVCSMIYPDNKSIMAGSIRVHLLYIDHVVTMGNDLIPAQRADG
jgi:hypothetical protein